MELLTFHPSARVTPSKFDAMDCKSRCWRIAAFWAALVVLFCSQANRSEGRQSSVNCSILTFWSAQRLHLTVGHLLAVGERVSHAYLNCLVKDPDGVPEQAVFTVVSSGGKLLQFLFVCTPASTITITRLAYPSMTTVSTTCQRCLNATNACQGIWILLSLKPVFKFFSMFLIPLLCELRSPMHARVDSERFVRCESFQTVDVKDLSP